MTRIYAAMEDALLVATADGSDWQSRTCLVDRRLECVATTTERLERILVGTFETGLQRSTDGGDTFERVGTDTIDQNAVLSLAVSPRDPELIWAGTEPSAVYRSTDGGETWELRPGLTDLPSADNWSFPPRPHTHHVRWLEPDPSSPGRLYLGIEAGAFVRTDDGGDTWQDHPDGARRDNHTLETHPDAEGLIYTAAGDGFAVSRDGGETWTHPQNGLEHGYCWSVVADPGDPSRVVLSAARGARTAHSSGTAQSYVYRREGGERWQRVESDTLPTGEGVLRTVFATDSDSGVVYAVNNRGLFRSNDAGKTWEVLAVEWPDQFETQTCRGLSVL